MDTSLQNTKIELIQWLTTVEDKAIIQKILEIQRSDDWWDRTSKAEQASIEKGISDADLGKLNTHDKAQEVYGKWL